MSDTAELQTAMLKFDLSRAQTGRDFVLRKIDSDEAQKQMDESYRKLNVAVHQETLKARLDEARAIKNGLDEYRVNGFETNQTTEEITDQLVDKIAKLKQELNGIERGAE